MGISPVTFIERSGTGARESLAALQARLAPADGATRLLGSRNQSELYLLLIEGDPSLTDSEREGARIWRFEDAGAARAPTTRAKP